MFYRLKFIVSKRLLNRELYDAQGSRLIDYANLQDGDITSEKRAVIVPAMSLEYAVQDILAQSDFVKERIHLIYNIDIEGSEFSVLDHFIKNASPLIKSIKSSFYIEWHERLFDDFMAYSKKREVIENKLSTQFIEANILDWH